MQLKSLFSVLAACASLVAAQDTTGTTTSTSTLTQTITITQCNPTVTNCPGRTNTTSSAWSYPLSNSTSLAGPTAYPNTTVIVPTTKSTSTSVVIATTSATTAAPTTVPSSGAGALIAQSGLLMGVLGAGIAILA